MNLKKKGPTVIARSGALNSKREEDLQCSQYDKEQIPQSSHWPGLVKKFYATGHHCNQ